MTEQDPEYVDRASNLVSFLNGKWTIRILLAMHDQPARLSELCRAIPEATKKMIIESLRRLEGAGLIRRNDLSKAVKHVEYQIDEGIKGSLLEILKILNTVQLSKQRGHDGELVRNLRTDRVSSRSESADSTNQYSSTTSPVSSTVGCVATSNRERTIP